MDTSEEQIDIVGVGSDHDETPMDADHSPIRPPLTMPSFPHLPLPNMPSFPLPLPGTAPLSIQVTPESEPSGAKKRKPQKTTKLQVACISYMHIHTLNNQKNFKNFPPFHPRKRMVSKGLKWLNFAL